MIFRYPGGKERLARKLLKDNTIPYADWNGECVSLKDPDNRTAAFWKILISSQDSVRAHVVKFTGSGFEEVLSDDPLMPTTAERES